MNARWLSHSMAGIALFLSVGAALTLIPASGTPISHSPVVTPSPIGGTNSGHALAANATCTTHVVLVAIPANVALGQTVTLQTQLFFHKSAPSAVCVAPVGFYYNNLPIGCVTMSIPQLMCTARGIGVFNSTVQVFFPGSSLGAATSVAVFIP
jgi:hypothetical protein